MVLGNGIEDASGVRHAMTGLLGHATSFAKPGGNVTGLFMDQPSLAGKWIELLREAAPSINRVALLWDAGTGRD